ncbi:MAG: PP2C family protein-serine/threonine phosphatase [Candidatus Gracilibacteria bacterium]
MDFFRRSIAKKAFITLFIGFLIFSVLKYLGRDYIDANFNGYGDFVLYFLLFVFAFAVFVFIIHLPLSKVFIQMKALLTSRPYKKIFTQRVDEVGVLAHFFNEVTKNMERLSLDMEEGRRMSKELSVGSDIQKKILPTQMPQIPGLLIHGSTRPASEVGGDSFDINDVNGNVYVYIGDVTGHGLPAGLIMVMVNTLIRTFSEVYQNGYDIIVNTNRILKQRIEPRRFMTCVLLRWNLQDQKMYYTGAGHEHIMIFHKKQGVCEVKQSGGIALGMVPDISKIIKEEQIPLESGDFVILYSDGITEAKNMQGEMFGIERLKNTISQYSNANTPEELFVNISKEFGNFVGQQIQADDITLIALKKL